jgi:hypothetical protein
MASEPIRTAATTVIAVGFDVAAGTGLLAAGAWLGSGWCVANAIYYLVLGASRAYLLRRLRQPSSTDGIRVYRRAGLLLGVVGVSYFFVGVDLVGVGEAPTSTGLAVYAVATVAFTKLGLAVSAVVGSRRSGASVVRAIQVTRLADALISIAVTQYALLTMTGAPNAADYSGKTAMGCAVVCAVGGALMATRKHPSAGSTSHSLDIGQKETPAASLTVSENAAFPAHGGAVGPTGRARPVPVPIRPGAMNAVTWRECRTHALGDPSRE